MDNLYSTSLSEHKGTLSPAINFLISKLKDLGVYTGGKLFDGDTGRVAIPITIEVSLPSGGTVDDIDIREVEPLLLMVSKNYYPFIAPKVHSDRKDFPKTRLPHLYAVADQAVLCINRNGQNDWFAEHTIEGFINSIKLWLYKAGSGLLGTDGNEFDPTRLDSYNGIHSYQYNKLYEIVTKKNSVAPEFNFAILFGSVGANSKDGLSYKSFEALPLIALKVTLEAMAELKKLKPVENPILSILCWSDKEETFSDYQTDLPKTLEDFENFCDQFSIDIKLALKFYITNKLNTRRRIPVILALKRPKKIVGYEGDVEFLNFTILGSNVQGMKIPKNAEVKNQSHIEPFTSELASRISGKENREKILFLGGGALGSKIFMHNLRGGNNKMTIVDKDIFLHHNLARHSLHSGRLGKNKAVALIKEAQDYFEVQQTKNLKAIPQDLLTLEASDFNEHQVIVDSTASLNVQNWLTVNPNIQNQLLFRAEIVHKGTLGLLYKEGKDRNPRIDDLVNYTYFAALSYPEIEAWRQYDSTTELENLPVGLGCSSTTVLIADDDISLHAAIFSKLISDTAKVNYGYVYLNNRSDEFPYIVKSNLVIVKPFENYACINDKSWNIRMADGISSRIHEASSILKPKEAAGVLVGLVNYKTKVVHVFDLIDAPSDSIAECACFYRGVHNLPNAIDEIKKRTGGLIGYIGEWHSHPMGLDSLSGQDRSNVAELKVINDKVPIPTLSIIVSNGKILPFIFE
ncbi:MAG: Mov34/MPN/PAD-1 family protein [Bacteroidia bacterium]|nr:Mov34/MPN/PAD-1 family protein [Bacteroidia bacterium]